MKHSCSINQRNSFFFFLFLSDQGLLLKIKKFSKPFNKDKQINRSIRHTMYRKGLKFALVVGLKKLTFTYITVLKKKVEK